MTKIPMIIDCDPGLDDAIALLLAIASSETIDLLGITTVAGNCSVDQTLDNARRLCALAGRKDLKVFRGCSRTFFSRVIPSTYGATDIHGDSGLGGCRLPPSTFPLQSQDAVSYLIKTLLESPQKITLALTGSLTNIACAFIMNPRIKEKIERIVLMGGAIGLGNITPTAEYNFYYDAHAAHVVFTAGVPVVMIGLDVTRQTQTSPKWLQRISALETPVSKAVIDMLSHYYRPNACLEPGVEGGVLHDPNVIAYLINPDLYAGRPAYVEIDISPTLMAGRSTIDWYGTLKLKPNAYVMNHVNVKGFFDLLTERLGRYGKLHPSS